MNFKSLKENLCLNFNILRNKMRLIWRNIDRLTKVYILLAVICLILSSATYVTVFSKTMDKPPQGPISIEAGSYGFASVNKTGVIINIPAHTIDIQVVLNLTNETSNEFLSVILPYNVKEVKLYAVRDSNRINEENIGYFGNLTSFHLNTKLGSSVINATFNFNQSLRGIFRPNALIGLGVTAEIDGELISREDSLSGSKSLICTFYGDQSGVWADEMSEYTQIGTGFTYHPVTEPFIVQIVAPSDYSYVSSQPSPIEHYVKQKNDWTMFTIDFLNGAYAQTINCNFENVTMKTFNQFYLFLLGVFVSMFFTFLFEAIKELGTTKT